MKAKGSAVRERIVETANELFYQQGFNQTSFSDIADGAGVPRGNFYYYFRSKDDILEAVIEHRLLMIRGMLAHWQEDYASPRRRLIRYVEILLNEEHDVMLYGCPMGSLNAELGKTQLAQQSRAAEMFSEFMEWLRSQFAELGYRRNAKDLALRLLSRTQGISLMSNVYRDPRFLRREVKQLKAWINEL